MATSYAGKSDGASHIADPCLTHQGARPWLVPGPVFKTGEGSGNRLLVGSIPMRSRHSRPSLNSPVSRQYKPISVCGPKFHGEGCALHLQEAMPTMVRLSVKGLSIALVCRSFPLLTPMAAAQADVSSAGTFDSSLGQDHSPRQPAIFPPD